MPLFVTLLGLLAGYPILREMNGAHLMLDGIVTAVFVAAFFTVFEPGRSRRTALMLGVPTLLGLWVGYGMPGLPRLPLVVGFHLLAVAFLIFGVATILLGVYRQKTVTSDTVFGVLCGYMLIGLAFGHIYCVFEAFTPGSFRGGPEFAERFGHEERSHQLLTYFSFMTLTTTGFGDITPTTVATRGFAVVEAITGQFYIAVLVAELIGKRVSQSLSPGGPLA